MVYLEESSGDNLGSKWATFSAGQPTQMDFAEQ